MAAATATCVAGNDSPGVSAPCNTTPTIRSSGGRSATVELSTFANSHAAAPPSATNRARRKRRASTQTIAITGTAPNAPSCITPMSGGPAASGSWLMSRNRLTSSRLCSMDAAANVAQTRISRPKPRRNTSAGCRPVAVRREVTEPQLRVGTANGASPDQTRRSRSCSRRAMPCNSESRNAGISFNACVNAARGNDTNESGPTAVIVASRGAGSNRDSSPK